MALTLSAMETEVYARGFSYLNDSGAGTARVARWLNDAMHEIDGLADWSYKMASTTGSAPLTIADLDVIECVTDVGNLNPLQPTDRRLMRKTYGDLTTTGTAWFYYFTSQTTITTYPVTTATLTVDYWKVGPDLSAGTDEPLMPDRFRMAIVEYALSKAHLDAENEASAQVCRQAGDLLVAQMMNTLLVASHQTASQWRVPVGEDN